MKRQAQPLQRGWMTPPVVPIIEEISVKHSREALTVCPVGSDFCLELQKTRVLFTGGMIDPPRTPPRIMTGSHPILSSGVPLQLQ